MECPVTRWCSLRIIVYPPPVSRGRMWIAEAWESLLVTAGLDPAVHSDCRTLGAAAWIARHAAS